MKTQLNIRQIEVFRAVMLAGSVVGGARLLNVTQPGISRTLAALEIRLGYPLFERKGRRLIPTTEAQALYREVEHIYVGVDRVSQLADDLRHQKAGALRVAAMSALSQWLIPQAVSSFMRGRTRVTVHVENLRSRPIADLVATRQVDLGFVELPLSMPTVKVHPLPAMPLVALVPRKHPLSRKRKISLKELDGESLVLLSSQNFIRHEIDEALTLAGATPRLAIETVNSAMVCNLASAGCGIGLVSRWVAKSVAGTAVAVVPLAEELLSRSAAIHSDAAPLSGLAQAFLDEVRRQVKSI